MILPVRGATSSASEHYFIPYIYVHRTLRVNCGVPYLRQAITVT